MARLELSRSKEVKNIHDPNEVKQPYVSEKSFFAALSSSLLDSFGTKFPLEEHQVEDDSKRLSQSPERSTGSLVDRGTEVVHSLYEVIDGKTASETCDNMPSIPEYKQRKFRGEPEPDPEPKPVDIILERNTQMQVDKNLLIMDTNSQIALSSTCGDQYAGENGNDSPFDIQEFMGLDTYDQNEETILPLSQQMLTLNDPYENILDGNGCFNLLN